jgi:hypothetical protein
MPPFLQRRCTAQDETTPVQRIAAQPADELACEANRLQGDVDETGSRSSLPSPLKAGLEALSGMDLSGVRVHHDSSKPAQLNALAYTQGQDIYIGPGQGTHLPHEGWHAVQQMQERVKPTMQAKGASINDDEVLEREADVMGAKALHTRRPDAAQVPTAEPRGRDPMKASKDTKSAIGAAGQKVHLNLLTARGRRCRVTQSRDPCHGTVQRVLGPPYPFQGIVTTRWNAALRRTASRTGVVLADLRRNTRVTAIGNSGNWLQVQTTIAGQVQTGFVSQELIETIRAAGFAPALARGGRVEVTGFGTFNVYPDAHRGPLQADELYEAEFRRLERAWTRIGNNSGGLLSHGAAADLATMQHMIGLGMARSPTFRGLILEITEDAAHPVTINVGRNNAYWVDAFATNRVDLSDTEIFDDRPRPGSEWAITRGELIVHWLAERRNDAVHGGGFAPAHAAPMAAGGLQEQFRADIGAPGRTVSQVRAGPVGGLHTGVYTDNAGNIMRIFRDGSGGDPVPYRVTYTPVGGGAVTNRRNNIVSSATSTTATPEDLYLKFTNAAHNVSSPIASVAAGAPLNFTTPLGGIVPTGGSVDVELYKERTWFLPDTLLGTLTWAHPFTAARRVVRVGGVDYTIRSELVMEP